MARTVTHSSAAYQTTSTTASAATVSRYGASTAHATTNTAQIATILRMLSAMRSRSRCSASSTLAIDVPTSWTAAVGAISRTTMPTCSYWSPTTYDATGAAATPATSVSAASSHSLRSQDETCSWISSTLLVAISE